MISIGGAKVNGRYVVMTARLGIWCPIQTCATQTELRDTVAELRRIWPWYGWANLKGATLKDNGEVGFYKY